MQRVKRLEVPSWADLVVVFQNRLLIDTYLMIEDYSRELTEKDLDSLEPTCLKRIDPVIGKPGYYFLRGQGKGSAATCWTENQRGIAFQGEGDIPMWRYLFDLEHTPVLSETEYQALRQLQRSRPRFLSPSQKHMLEIRGNRAQLRDIRRDGLRMILPSSRDPKGAW